MARPRQSVVSAPWTHIVLLAALLFAGSALLAAQGGNPPQPQRTAAPPAIVPPATSQTKEPSAVALPGVANFGRVTPALYRGAQPTAEGFPALKKLGVKIVINFRDERGKIESERRAVESLGMRYVSIPIGASHDPNSEQVAEFLEVVRANPQRKIFVHCHLGADRSGVMVAVYRMAAENWTPEQALTEMRAYHYHHFWWPHYQRYVERFPALLAADSKLRAASPAAVGAP